MSEASKLIRDGHHARREDRPADALRDFGEAVTLARRLGNARDLVHALKGLGQLERDQGDGDRARPLYEEAVALCRTEDDPLLLAHTVRHLGDIHQDAGRIDLAEPCYHEALALYRVNHGTSVLDLANAVRPLALLKEKTGEIEESMRLWEEARNLYASLHLGEGVDEASARLSRLRGQN